MFRKWPRLVIVLSQQGGGQETKGGEDRRDGASPASRHQQLAESERVTRGGCDGNSVKLEF